jgi:hypothetical protein
MVSRGVEPHQKKRTAKKSTTKYTKGTKKGSFLFFVPFVYFVVIYLA